MKRSIILILVSFLLLGQISFSMPSSWAQESIDYAVENRLVPYSLLSNFQEPITREEFAEIAVLLYEAIAGETAPMPQNEPFMDTPNPEILKAYQLGIVTGKGNGRFVPWDLITRQEIAVMFYRTLIVSKTSTSTTVYPSFFRDEQQIASWAKESVHMLSQLGILSGVGDSRMNPLDHATREEAVALTTRIHKYSIHSTPTSPTASPTPVEKILSAKEIGQFARSVVMLHVQDHHGENYLGSGFFYEPGRIGTNYHVIKDAHVIEIEFDDGSLYTGNVWIVGYDRDADLVALAIDLTTTPALNLGNSDYIERGQKIYTIGSPMGLLNTLGSGIVSSVRYQSIQITAPISPGSSGGVLMDDYGFVVGITNSGIIEGENLGFAIPINLFKNMDKSIMISFPESVATDEVSQTLRTLDATYFGEIKDGLPHGVGTMTWDNGDLYVGEWVNGVIEGSGVMTFTNGNRYEGQFKNWLYHGEGTYFSDNGEIYVGEWAEGFFDGYGIYTWPDGKSYKGEWKAGMFHGQGTYTFEDGSIMRGLWQYGEFVM